MARLRFVITLSSGSRLASAFLAALIIGFMAPRVRAQICPAVDYDTDCGMIITITDQGASASATGQPPYEGADDILVGVENYSSLPVSAIGLDASGSGNQIFAFDGDGIDNYGIPGNLEDATGYGGPDAFFLGYPGNYTSGTVNFITPIPPKGGTDFFGLESALNSATACGSLIYGQMSQPSVNGPEITASFTPLTSPSTTGISGTNSSLLDAATVCGFVNFDWQQQVIVLPAPSPFRAAANPTTPLVAPPFFFDPTPGGSGSPPWS